MQLNKQYTKNFKITYEVVNNRFSDYVSMGYNMNSITLLPVMCEYTDNTCILHMRVATLCHVIIAYFGYI